MDKLVFSCFLLGGLTPDPGPPEPCALNAYCAAGLTNVGCDPPPITGGPACDGLNAHVLPLLADEQNFILSFMNDKRNSFASGSYGNSQANRMFTLQWDANLATQAGHNARSCNVARDACRNTADYANVGQLYVTYENMLDSLGDTTRNQLNNILLNSIFFDAYMFGQASLSSYSVTIDTENEANILNDRSSKVGCALMEWYDLQTLFHYLVCNFSDNVTVGQPIYTPAATAGMGCATADTTYTSLCLT